jgi:hypothetical protein
MTIYLALVAFDTNETDLFVADYVFYGYKSEAEAKMLYPEAEVIQVEIGVDPQTN